MRESLCSSGSLSFLFPIAPLQRGTATSSSPIDTTSGSLPVSLQPVRHVLQVFLLWHLDPNSSHQRFPMGPLRDCLCSKTQLSWMHLFCPFLWEWTFWFLWSAAFHPEVLSIYRRYFQKQTSLWALDSHHHKTSKISLVELWKRGLGSWQNQLLQRVQGDEIDPKKPWQGQQIPAQGWLCSCLRLSLSTTVVDITDWSPCSVLLKSNLALESLLAGSHHWTIWVDILCPITLFFLLLCLPKTVSGELNSRFQRDLHRAAHCAFPCSSRTYCLSCEPRVYFWKPECQNKLASCVRPGADGSLTSCSLALISHFEALNVRSSINIFIIAFLLCSYLGYRCVGANIPFLLFLKKKISAKMINSYVFRVLSWFLIPPQMHINIGTWFNHLLTHSSIPQLFIEQ